MRDYCSGVLKAVWAYVLKNPANFLRQRIESELIEIGHMMAVYLAHIAAMRVYADTRRAPRG